RVIGSARARCDGSYTGGSFGGGGRGGCWQRGGTRGGKGPPPTRGGRGPGPLRGGGPTTTQRRPRGARGRRQWAGRGGAKPADRGAPYQLYVGIDIAAETFTAAWLAPGAEPVAPLTCDQTPPGYAALQQRLQRTGVPPAATLVALEATGNYWVALAVALHEAG